MNNNNNNNTMNDRSEGIKSFRDLINKLETQKQQIQVQAPLMQVSKQQMQVSPMQALPQTVKSLLPQEEIPETFRNPPICLRLNIK